MRKLRDIDKMPFGKYTGALDARRPGELFPLALDERKEGR